MHKTGDTIHILHVDDDTRLTELVSRFLQKEDDRFDVQTAANAAEGLERLEDGEFDCIISDYDMPGQNGIDFLRTVREEYSNLPFVLYTGKGSEEVASEAIRAGVTDYLQKDTGTDQYTLLSNRVRNAVESYRANQQAEAVQRVNTVVRNIDGVLVRATTRSEVDDNVCEILSDAEPYQFAWIGEYDPESRTVVPRSSAGIEADYLEAVEITTDRSPTGRGPTGQAVQTGEIAVMQNIPGDPAYEPWREAALERGYRSSAAVPLVHEGTMYGVLNVYADRTFAFDERERQLLSSVGGTIAHALHRIELQQEYTDQYRTLFEEAPVMVVFTRAVDGEPIIEDCNRAFAERLGYSREELRGTPLSDHYTETSTGELLERDGYERALTGEFLREQRTLVTREGREILTVLRATPRRDRDGEIIGTHALYLDITDEQQVRELRRQNDRLEEFASVLSHDLRNPLSVAKGRLELAAEECDSEDLEHVRKAHDRMEALIEDLLTLAREGAAVTDREPVEVSSLVERCWSNVETADATLRTEADRTVLADESRLKQVFENLIHNAVEHGGEDVTVTFGELDDGIYVEDDGSGIPADDHDDVFETGYSTREEGTGFGLSIVEGIVEAHDWAIEVTDGADGGARFEITGIDFADR
ncbi:GAF domain-containing protein [Natronomonas gomsonensis]|jgi:PAS domain S-box-containing protein|uniref:GAF domain-containing protein n=1 Tax=Natronomonas gomsonensis TaxID=1046043 RepID=UPI0020CA44E4|nr:GAF domain-containing protein [Natronomonas gomsonensis]MCY4732224.1 GAF domain-containing protein [Natronomonas gomsonensis]